MDKQYVHVLVSIPAAVRGAFSGDARDVAGKAARRALEMDGLTVHDVLSIHSEPAGTPRPDPIVVNWRVVIGVTGDADTIKRVRDESEDPIPWSYGAKDAPLVPVQVAHLRPGMITPDWIVVGSPVLVGDEYVIDMEHRVDHGRSSIAYPRTHVISVVE